MRATHVFRLLAATLSLSFSALAASAQAPAPTPKPGRKPAPKSAARRAPTGADPRDAGRRHPQGFVREARRGRLVVLHRPRRLRGAEPLGPAADLRPHLRGGAAAARQDRRDHRRRRPPHRVLRRRQGHDELPSRREPRRGRRRPDHDRRRAREAFQGIRHLLSVHRRHREGPVGGHRVRADRRLLRRRVRTSSAA